MSEYRDAEWVPCNKRYDKGRYAIDLTLLIGLPILIFAFIFAASKSAGLAKERAEAGPGASKREIYKSQLIALRSKAKLWGIIVASSLLSAVLSMVLSVHAGEGTAVGTAGIIMFFIGLLSMIVSCVRMMILTQQMANLQVAMKEDEIDFKEMKREIKAEQAEAANR
ncbi:MAG: hypothetical protein KJ626_06470 [Verrucomicrobia bacterium]|nr:hypothetical protein [Verrucomicrobiota bacterium]